MKNNIMNIEEMKQHEWVVSWSGGKDSTATILYMRHYNIPIKKIIYVRMMYDKDMSANVPVVDIFIDKMIKKFTKWGYNVEVVNSILTAKDLMNKKYKRPIKYKDRKGKKWGYTAFSAKACRFAGIKQETIRKCCDKNEYNMLGICYDEPRRFKILNEYNQSILVTLKKTQNRCYKVCKKFGFLNPIYELGFKRDGCFFCPNKHKNTIEIIKKDFPDLYEEVIGQLKYVVELCNGEPTILSNWLEYAKQNNEL